MANRTVSVKFWCDFGATELEYRHSIPKTLIMQAGRAQPSSEYSRRFLEWIGPIFKEHEASCRKIAEAYCEGCSNPAKDILQSPMSFLHAETPFVLVVVSWFCGQEECEIRMREEMQDTVAGMGKTDRSTGPRQKQGQEPESTEGKVCRVSGETAGARWCSRCQAVAYCGREHQKADWKAHKKGCKPKKCQEEAKG